MCLKNINVNPSNRITQDAFVRAVCLALNISYKEAYRAIAEFALGASLSMTDSRTIKGFLKSLGYYEQKLKNNCSVATFSENKAKARVHSTDNYDEDFYVSIEKYPKIVIGRCNISDNDLNAIKKFIVDNLDILLEYWNSKGQMDGRDLYIKLGLYKEQQKWN